MCRDLTIFSILPDEGSSLYRIVLDAPHCLGEGRVRQLLSSQHMVQMHTPFMPIVKMHRSQEDGNHKNMQSEFQSTTFLAEETCFEPFKMMPASFDDLSSWLLNKSERGGFYMNVNGEVSRGVEVPAFEECTRDERHLKFVMNTLDWTTLAICRVICKNTLAECMERVLMQAESGNLQNHCRLICEDDHCWGQEQLHVLLAQEYMVVFKCQWDSGVIKSKEENMQKAAVYFSSTCFRIAFMKYTYFNEVHAATIVRAMPHPKGSFWQERLPGRESATFEQVPEDRVVELIKGNVRRFHSLHLSSAEGVD
jgi:hypothetical protein